MIFLFLLFSVPFLSFSLVLVFFTLRRVRGRVESEWSGCESDELAVELSPIQTDMWGAK